MTYRQWLPASIEVNLLITNNSHVLTGLEYLVQKGATSWAAVSIDLPRPCILIHHAEKDGPAWVSQTIVLWRSQDVLSMCRDVKANKSRKIWSVAMLRFDKEANKHELSLTQIKEIRAVDSGRTGVALPVYVTTTNDRIDERGSVCSGNARTDVEKLWHAPRKRSAPRSIT
jgi:hypothetical protein